MNESWVYGYVALSLYIFRLIVMLTNGGRSGFKPDQGLSSAFKEGLDEPLL